MTDPALGPPPGGRILGWSARLVPRRERDAWRREWEAEVAYAWRRMNVEGPPTRIAVVRLRLRVTASWIDALSQRGETMKMTGLWNDVRFGLRGLFRSPTFTAITIGTLALGIGATTAIFSVVNGVLLKPLPFEHPDELVGVMHTAPGMGAEELGLQASQYFTYREENQFFEDIACGIVSVPGAPQAAQKISNGPQKGTVAAGLVTCIGDCIRGDGLIRRFTT